MAIDLSTAGITLNYGVETTADTKPTAFIHIPGVKSIPELNPEPKSYESTSLDATEFTSYVKGLKDIGGSLAFKFNLTEAFKTIWEGVVTASTTASSSGKATWFQVIIPGLTESFYFKGDPSSLGMPSADVGGILETTAYVVPTKVIGWDEKVAVA